MAQLKYDKTTLRKFGISMGLVFGIITLVTVLRSGYVNLPLITVSALFFVLSLFAPQLLKCIYLIWMRLAWALSWFNTRLILILMFYLIFAPAGLIMRIFKIDLLDRRPDRNSQTYWIKKEKKTYNPSDYERQF